MLLEVKKLNIQFHDQLHPQTVVSDVDLTLEEGEILGIVGESGSGKSMTAHAIAGLLSRHDMKKTGEILFAGKNLLICPRSELRAIQGKDISVIFQEPMTSLNPLLTIGEQVEEPLRIHTKDSPAERKEKALEMMRKVELPSPEELYRKYPHQLSGGMRQRVMIAAALITSPSLIIADEPTTALDVTIQAQILKLLKRINQKEGTGILFISHDLGVVRKLCDRVIVMNQGKAVEQGMVEEIFRNPTEAYTRKLLAAIPDRTTSLRQRNRGKQKSEKGEIEK